MNNSQEPHFEKAEEYQTSYDECFKVIDASPNETINSLCFLIEEMIETIRELEEYRAKQVKLQASARTDIN